MHHRRASAAGLALALVLSWALSPAASWGQPVPHGLGSGLAGLLAFGNQSGGVGLELIYYQRLGDRPFHIAPHLGGGMMGLRASQRGSLGWCAGLLFIYGHRHRLVVATDYGVIDRPALHLHQSFVTWGQVLGPQLGLGYEFVRANGFVFQFIPAVGYPTAGPIGSAQRELQLGLSVNFGWKAW